MLGVQTYISLFFMHFTAFFMKWEEPKSKPSNGLEEASTSRTMARAEPQLPQSQVEPNARGTRVPRG